MASENLMFTVNCSFQGAGTLWLLVFRPGERRQNFHYLLVFCGSDGTPFFELRGSNMTLDDKNGAWIYDKSYSTNKRPPRPPVEKLCLLDSLGGKRRYVDSTDRMEHVLLFSYRDPTGTIPTRFDFKDGDTTARARAWFKLLKGSELHWALVDPDDFGEVWRHGEDTQYDEHGKTFKVMGKGEKDPKVDKVIRDNSDDPKVDKVIRDNVIRDKVDKAKQSKDPKVGQSMGDVSCDVKEERFRCDGTGDEIDDADYGKTLQHAEDSREYDKLFQDREILSVLTSGRTDDALRDFDEKRANNPVFDVMCGKVVLWSYEFVLSDSDGRDVATTLPVKDSEQNVKRRDASLMEILKLPDVVEKGAVDVIKNVDAAGNARIVFPFQVLSRAYVYRPLYVYDEEEEEELQDEDYYSSPHPSSLVLPRTTPHCSRTPPPPA